MTLNPKKKIKYSLIALVIIGVISGGVYFLFSSSPKPAEAAWYDESWLYRQKTEITNSSSAQTDFQVLITLDTATLITASKMQSDCDDIRITDINGKLLSHWLEPSTCNTSTSKIWTKVPSIPTTGATVYIYYGNPSAVSVSSPTNTFIREISGVQGAWNMDETSWTNDCSTNTTLDSSGNSNHGKSCPASTGPNTTSTAQFARAGSFDGVNDYVVTSPTTVTNFTKTNAFTIAGWVYNATIPTNWEANTIASNTGSDYYKNWNFSYDQYQKFYGTVGYYDGSWHSLTVTSQSTYGAATWYYVAYVNTGIVGEQKMYVNGVDDTGTLENNMDAFTYPGAQAVYIGRRGVISDSYMDGTIDEVRIYNKALSAAEISDLYGAGGDRQGYVTSNYPNKSLVRKYSSSVSVGSPASEERGPGPAAYWKFDEGYGQTANDTTLNNNDGTLGSTAGSDTNDPTWQTEDMCVSGKCLKFDGTDDYVNVPRNSSIEPQNLTLEAWIKPSVVSGNRTIFDKPYTSHTDPYYSYEMRIQEGQILFAIVVGAFSSADYVLGGTIVANNWYHVVGTYDGTIRLYINGDKIAEKNNTGTISYFDKPLTIGEAQNFVAYFNGFIDDVRIYPYARTEAQIKADYASRGMAKGASAVIGGGPSTSSGQYPLSQGLIGYWKMDESSWTNDCSTATVTDSSGAGNHGKSCPASTGPNTTSTAKFAKAGSFDGTDDYVDAGTSTSLNITNAITISAWVKPLSYNNGGIVSKTSGDHGGYNILLLSNEKVRLMIGDGVNIDTESIMSNSVIPLSEWSHVVFTFKGADKERIFLNGNIDNEQNVTKTLVGSNIVGVIGYGQWISGTYFSGQIDEVRIYNRALSPKEVRDLYNWAPGPVAHWKMDENTGQSANDTSGNGNTGTLGSSSAEASDDPSWTSGKIGAGLQFDGVDDYVDCGSGASLDITSAITLEAWMKTNTIAAGEADIIVKRSGWGVNAVPYEIQRSGSEIYFMIYKDTFKAAGFGGLEVGVWTHIAATYDSNNLRIYKNGVLSEASPSTEGMPSLPTKSVYIGARGGTGIFFNGSIDDVRIYNYARTQKQIVEDMLARQSFSGGGNADCDNTVLCTKFDEGYGSTAQDSSPQNNDGTLYPGSGGTNTTTAQMWSNSGKFGKAMEFDGTDDYVSVGNPASLNITDAITISAWVKPNRDRGSIVRKYDGTYTGYRLDGGIDDNKFQAWIPNGTVSKYLFSNSLIQYGVWQHLVVTFKDNNFFRMYINGNLDKDYGTVDWGLQGNSAILYIGERDFHTVEYFSGLIDEVKIYNYALTEDEIKLEYNRGAAVHLGSVSTGSDGTTPSYSSERSYCIPGDTSTCNPPVAEWTFNEKTGQSANDTSGNGNTGTLGSSSAEASDDPSWTSGKIGAGLQFDGVDDYVNAGNGASLDITDAITIEAWVKTNSAPASYTFILWRALSDNSKRLYMYIGSDSKIHFGTYDASVFEEVSYDYSSSFGQYKHIVGVYNKNGGSNNMKIYENGVQKSQNTYTRAIPTLTGRSLYFGGTPSSNFLGSIDEPRIYNYARTPAQIAWDYNRGKPVAHWKFDECQGATAYDASPSTGSGQAGNNGTTTIGASGTQDGIGTCTDGDTTNARYNGRNGKYNSALNFDGTDDYVDAGNAASLNITGSARTISAWVKPNGASEDGYIVGKYGGVGQTGYALYWQGSTDKISSWLSTPQVDSNAVFTDSNVWVHVALVYSGSTYTFYRNGVLAGSGSGTEAADSANAYIGNRQGGTSVAALFNGLIDEVKIFNYALTPQQIKNEYNEGAAIRFGPSTGSP